jgi:predicted DNA-binding transcriptional regulator YafY
MSRSDETLYRQWVMLTKIPRHPRRITVPQLKSILLGEGYTVDTRTIQRDLNKLSGQFPLNCDSEGRKNFWFWIEDAAVSDLPGMEPVTALAFEMAESYLTPLLPTATLSLLKPYFDRARSILSDQSDSKLRKWPDKVAVIERGPTLQKPIIDPDLQQTIYQALLEEKTITAQYLTKSSKQAKEYLIHPLGIVSRMGVIYLICTLWDYEDIKQFALHRFTKVTFSDEPFKINKEFNLQQYIESDQQFSYPIQKDEIDLKVLFDAERASHLAETPLTKNQKLTQQSDGKILLEATLTDTLDLRWWLQGFADKVEVLEPSEMREEFKKVADRLLNIYKH